MKSSSIISTKQKRAFAAGAVTFFAVFAILAIDEELESLKGGYLRQIRKGTSGRWLSLSLGGGKCEWKAPVSTVPAEIDLWKTLLVGFPSGAKHVVSAQMEALSGLPSKEDWDLVFNGFSNTPFIKTSYPHQSGVWSWDDGADQVALAVQDIRQSMMEYSDTFWSMSDESDSNEIKSRGFHEGAMITDAYLNSRDHHMLLEIYKYGWYIEYWMENGLLRDPYSHEVVDLDNWQLFSSPEPIKNDKDRVVACHHTSSDTNPLVAIEISASVVQKHIDHGGYIGTCKEAAKDATFMSKKKLVLHDDQTTQDPNCDKITNSCRPVKIFSADNLLLDGDTGRKENEIIGNTLMRNEKMAKWIVDKEAWPCLWNEVLDQQKQDKDILQGPKFSLFMLKEMKGELQRLVDKYSTDPWTDDSNAKRLVSLLSGHFSMLQKEIIMVASGLHKLSKTDFFGPGERQSLFGETTE